MSPISQLTGTQGLRAAQAVAAFRGASAQNTTSQVARQADSVSLSDGARSLSAARASVGGAADVREDRIAAIKASIADGSYTVSSKQLAQSMVKNLLG